MTKEAKKKYCSGCYNSIYNGALAKECWYLESAELVMRKEVHVDQVPPWNQKPRKFLSCYHKPRYCYVSPGKAVHR